MKRFRKQRSRAPKKNARTPQPVYVGSADTGKGTVRILPLGGTGGVTKNMFVYEYLYDGAIKDILIIDSGIGFPEPDMHGVDLLIPDVRYLQDKKDKIRGLVFTHGHEDHFGGIPYTYPQLGTFPMWGTKLTAALANLKLKDASVKANVQAVEFDSELTIGPFTVSFIRVTHSVPDTAHLVIRSPAGVIYHGSDFKFDFHPLDGKETEFEKIRDVGEKGVLCLLTDCLGSERVGFTPSEQVIGETIETELAHCNGKFLFTSISSNISRIQLAIDIAHKHGRDVALLGRSINQNVEEAVKLGYMTFPRDRVIRDRDLRKLPDEKQFLIVAGSQGQAGSALARIADGDHSYVSITDRDTVMISSDPIPGNETNVYNLIDQLYREGARVAYTSITEDLHVSGHGYQSDLMLLLSMLGPKYVFPIGGTYRHIMQYRRLARELGYDKRDVLIPNNGESITFRPGQPPKVSATTELEQVMVDGVGDVGEVVLRDRRTIAKEGIVAIVVPVDAKSGKRVADPEVVSRGFVYMKESNAIVKDVQGIVSKLFPAKKGKIKNWQDKRRQVERSVSKYLRKETGRNPLIVTVTLEV